MALSTVDAEQLAARWVSRFTDHQAYLTSVERYFDKVPASRRSFDGLDRWLAADCEDVGVRTALLSPIRPETENAPQQLPDLVDDCPTCRGKRLLRRDLPPGHADFGKLVRCPSCGGSPTGRPPRDPVVDYLAERAADVCSKCRQTRSQPAGDACDYRRWHYPNEAEPVPDVPGWKRAVA